MCGSSYVSDGTGISHLMGQLRARSRDTKEAARMRSAVESEGADPELLGLIFLTLGISE